MRTAWLGLALALVAGCSDDGSAGPNGGSPSGSDDCSLTVELGGEVQQSVRFGSSEGCGGGSDATTSMLAMGWGGITNPLNFHVTVEPVGEGALGTFPATVRVKDGSRTWRTADGDCSVELTVFERTSTDTFRHYRLVGSGSCASAALAAEGGATGSVSVGPFEFRGITIY